MRRGLCRSNGLQPTLRYMQQRLSERTTLCKRSMRHKLPRKYTLALSRCLRRYALQSVPLWPLRQPLRRWTTLRRWRLPLSRWDTRMCRPLCRSKHRPRELRRVRTDLRARSPLCRRKLCHKLSRCHAHRLLWRLFCDTNQPQSLRCVRYTLFGWAKLRWRRVWLPCPALCLQRPMR